MPRKAPRYQVGEYWLSQRSGSPNWFRTWYERATGRTRRASLGSANFRAAKGLLDAWFAEHVRPVKTPRSEFLIEEALHFYNEDHASKLASAQQIRIAMAWLRGFYGQRSVADLTMASQRDYHRARTAEGVGDNTVARELSVLGAALRHAFRHEMLESVPPIYRPKPAPKAPKGRALSLEEIAKLIDAAGEPHVFSFIMVLINTCCRPDAALDLTLERCDRKAGLVYLNPEGRAQTKKFRPIVPMTDALRRHLVALPGPHVVQIKGERIAKLKRAVPRTAARAGLAPGVTAYSIRHTMGRELARRGVSEWERKGMLGHSQGGMSDIYAPYDPRYLSAAREAIDALMAELDAMSGRALTGVREVR